MAAEIADKFGEPATLIKSRGGVFEVTLDGALLFSKKESGRFPAGGEVAALLAGRLPATS